MCDNTVIINYSSEMVATYSYIYITAAGFKFANDCFVFNSTSFVT